MTIEGGGVQAWHVAMEHAFDAIAPREDFFAAAAQMRHEFFETLARAVEPVLNRYISGRAQQSLEEKQKLASEVGQILKSMNLCVRHPVFKDACHIVADPDYAQAGTSSRFRLYSIGTTVQRRTNFKTLPALELMEAPVRKEPLSRRR